MQKESKQTDLAIKAVIYATDLSLCCQNVGHYASFMAEHLSAELLVAHAFTLSQAAMEVEFDPELVSEQRKDLEFLLSRKADRLSRGGVRAISALVEGDPQKVLTTLADAHAPSLVVLGTHGGGWVERELIGSVAEKILRSTSWPVLTVGPRVRFAHSKELCFKRILYATDFTPAAARAAEYAVWFASKFNSNIEVLNVIERESLDQPERLRDLTSTFSTAMEKAVPTRAKEFASPKAFVEVGSAHHQILRHVKDHAIDLLILGIKKTSHLGIVTRTSRAFQLIVDATCPVLTIVSEA